MGDHRREGVPPSEGSLNRHGPESGRNGSFAGSVLICSGQLLYHPYVLGGGCQVLHDETVTCLNCGEFVTNNNRLAREIVDGSAGIKPGLDLSDAYVATLDEGQVYAVFAEQDAYLRTVLPPDLVNPFIRTHRCWIKSEETARTNAAVALDRACMFLEHTREGRRNSSLNRAAYIEGRAAIATGLERRAVEQALYEAAIKAGLDHNETISTIRSGLGWP